MARQCTDLRVCEFAGGADSAEEGGGEESQNSKD